MPNAVRVDFGRCAMVRLRLATAAALRIFLLAAARCFALAINGSPLTYLVSPTAVNQGRKYRRASRRLARPARIEWRQNGPRTFRSKRAVSARQRKKTSISACAFAGAARFIWPGTQITTGLGHAKTTGLADARWIACFCVQTAPCEDFSLLLRAVLRLP